MSTFDNTEIQDDDQREDARQLSLQGNDPPGEVEGYSIIRRLGTGAYGTVWLAREDRTGRMVAIKYYPHRRGLNWSLLNREVEKLATLYASRNIVRLLDVGWNAEPPYYVMEFVENGSLGGYLATTSPSVEEAVRIARQVCLALIEAHGAGVLHCDLKPDNVLLDAQFQVRLCDFGQSRMSHEQSPALGTLYYMAPEQADLEAIPDARWDVYAVGALLYHLLTGQPPYRSPEIQRQLEAAESLQDRLTIYQHHIRNSPPADLHTRVKGVDRHLAAIVDQCLAVDPRDRLPNAQAVVDLLAARDRQRARRPLLLLGVLGPVLLVCAMVPLFVGAVRRNISEMESQLIGGVLQSNLLAARGQANSLQTELQIRMVALEAVAERPEIVRLLTEVMRRPAKEVVDEVTFRHELPLSERPAWMQALDIAREQADAANDDQDKSRDTSWFLTDAQGNQLWRRNYDSKTVGQNYAWRDYFHGRDVQYDKDQIPADVRPIQEAHVSVAFVSEGTRQYMVALSVPVRSAGGDVIGVLARTLHLGDLQQRLGQDIQGSDLQGDAAPIIALADRRSSHLLDHEWLKADVFRDQSIRETQQMFEQLRLSEQTLTSIQDAIQQAGTDASRRNIGIRQPAYQDPVGLLDDAAAKQFSGSYIAAMSTMKSDRMPWLVIVQQRRDQALKPVRDMELRATRQIWYAVLVSIATMAGIWLFVWQALARTQQRTRRSDLPDSPAYSSNESN